MFYSFVYFFIALPWGSVWLMTNIALPYCNWTHRPAQPPIAHVWYMKILTWLRGFRVKIANFLRLLCLAIPRRDLRTKKTKPKKKHTKPNKEKWSESLGVMLEFWYIERGLLVNALPHAKLLACHTPLQRHVDFGSMVTSFSESIAEISWKFRQKHSCESRNFSTHQGVIYPHSPTWYKDVQTHCSASWALWLRVCRRPNSELIYLQLLPESIHDGQKSIFLLPFGLYGKELVNWEKLELVAT